VTPIALQEHARILRVHRSEGEIVVVGKREVVGYLNCRAELVGMAIVWHQEARLPLDRRIGALEPGQPDHRHAEEVEERAVVGKGGLVTFVRDLLCANAPGRWLGRVLLANLARREQGFFEHGDVSGLTHGGLRLDAGVVLGDESHRVDESVAEIIGKRDVVRGDHRAVGILNTDVAHGGKRVVVAVVDDAVSKQRVVAEIDLDIALGGDTPVRIVINHFVGLQQHGGCLIDFRRLYNLFPIGLGLSQRLPTRQKSGEQAGENAGEKGPAHARRRPVFRCGEAGQGPAEKNQHREIAGHHPSSLYKSTVSASEAAMITGTQAAAAAEVNPAMAKLREISDNTKNKKPEATPKIALICTLPKRKPRSEQVAAINTMVTSRNGRDRRSWYCTRYWVAGSPARSAIWMKFGRSQNEIENTVPRLSRTCAGVR